MVEARFHAEFKLAPPRWECDSSDVDELPGY